MTHHGKMNLPEKYAVVFNSVFKRAYLVGKLNISMSLVFNLFQDTTF